MNASRIYRETMRNLAVAISGHKCPNGRASVRAFCEAYGFNRPHLCQLLLGTCQGEMSVGLYLRISAALGTLPAGSSAPTNTDDAGNISLRQYLQIDNTALSRSILALEFS